MSKIIEALTKLKERNNTVSDLIKLGQIQIKSNGIHRLKFDELVEETELKTVFDNENVSISVVDFTEEGEHYPDHQHSGIVEYIICIKGSFGILFPHNGYRILKEKECAKIPSNTIHSSITLEPNSSLIGICLPAEPGYVKQEKEGV